MTLSSAVRHAPAQNGVVKLWHSHLAKEHHVALDDLTRFNAPLGVESSDAGGTVFTARLPRNDFPSRAWR